jgi:di/tricarboxylate transporter
MDWQAWATLAVVAAMLVALARELAPPDLILLAALFTLAALGILTPSEVFRGFGNEGMATVGALFVVAAALTETGALEGFAARVFGQVRGERGGLLRICMPVAGLSAFLNNTPIVAMMTPVVIDWARRQRISPSRFLLPMDFATILGGCVTLIGTSTNLVVAGLVLQAGMEPMGFFELAPVGLPVAAVGMLYLVVIAPRVLPARRELMEQLGDQRREYTVSMRVDPSGPPPRSRAPCDGSSWRGADGAVTRPRRASACSSGGSRARSSGFRHRGGSWRMLRARPVRV